MKRNRVGKVHFPNRFAIRPAYICRPGCASPSGRQLHAGRIAQKAAQQKLPAVQLFVLLYHEY